MGAASFFVAAGTRETIWRAFVVALVALTLLYRLALGVAIYFQTTQIPRLQPAAVPVGRFLQATFNDFAGVGLLALFYLGLKILMGRLWPRRVARPIFKIGEGLLVLLLVGLLALVTRTHYQLLLQLDTGLTLDFVKTAPALVEPGDFFRMLTWLDVAFIFTPVLVFLLAGWFGRHNRRPDKYGFALLLGFGLCAHWAGPQTLPPEIGSSPVVYFAHDAVDDWVNGLLQENDFYARRGDMPDAAQTNSIQLVDAAFVHPRPSAAPPRAEPAVTADGRAWNILFFVLESSGADYVFDTAAGNPAPMPFLQKMTGGGLYLSRHFASANNTAKAAFSLFTGLYPGTGHKILAMEKDMAIPTLNRYLPADYDFFLIHPTPPESSFPPALFLNNGLKDFYHQDNLPPDRHPAPNGLARNEIDSFDFLIARLDRAREPFLGIYWSFLPHFPYADYGPEFRVLPGTTKRQKYYNNLRTLDAQLQRVYEHLVQTGMADRTLFVFVGDHGEAFGQHPEVWAHTFGFNSEMFRVPMLFWQPKLVAPQVIKFPTSHVDVVPTLLDLLGFPVDETRFQGESVLRGAPRRKYIFTTDAHSEYISAISPSLDKVTLGFHQNYFGAFNLARDPGEKLALDEKNFGAVVEAILKFRNYQKQMLEDYNRAILTGQPFPPKELSPVAP
jgi:Sulfatase